MWPGGGLQGSNLRIQFPTKYESFRFLQNQGTLSLIKDFMKE